MKLYTTKHLEAAHQVVTSTIANCEKMQPKFKEGTSQHSLLKNRIKALYICKYLIEKQDITLVYSSDDLKAALPPVTSIISKCEKGIQKFEEGTSHYTRFNKIITSMSLSKDLIMAELNSRDEVIHK